MDVMRFVNGVSILLMFFLNTLEGDCRLESHNYAKFPNNIGRSTPVQIQCRRKGVDLGAHVIQHDQGSIDLEMMVLKDGGRVEVSRKEQGFIGSYYEATIVNFHNLDNIYTICYKELLRDDDSGPLLEDVDSSEIRPYPPIVTVEYRVRDIVDAFENDGWWVGVLVKIRDGFGYVRFDDYNKIVVAYAMSKIRIHLDWVDNDKWSITSISLTEKHRFKSVEC